MASHHLDVHSKSIRDDCIGGVEFCAHYSTGEVPAFLSISVAYFATEVCRLLNSRLDLGLSCHGIKLYYGQVIQWHISHDTILHICPYAIKFYCWPLTIL